MNDVRQEMALSISVIMSVRRLTLWRAYSRRVEYFDQFIQCGNVGSDEVIGESEMIRSMGLWS